MTALIRLRQLTMNIARYESSGYGPLSALHSLRHLKLSACRSLPSNLCQLTWLEALTLLDEDFDMQEECIQNLLSALPRLTGLTYLALDSMVGFDSPPAALAGLSHLHTFVWLEAISTPGADAALPAGPWLGSLRRLAAPACLLANSLPVLAGAPRLEHLAVTNFTRPSEATYRLLRAPMYWSSVEKLSLLYSPFFLSDKISLPPAMVAAALEAQRQRPSLRVDFSPFVKENLWLDAEFVD